MTRIPCSCTVATDCPAHGAFARMAPAAAPRDAEARLEITEARGWAARVWCEPEHSAMEMDARLAESIAHQLVYAFNRGHGHRDTEVEALRGQVRDLRGYLRWIFHSTDADIDRRLAGPRIASTSTRTHDEDMAERAARAVSERNRESFASGAVVTAPMVGDVWRDSSHREWVLSGVRGFRGDTMEMTTWLADHHDGCGITGCAFLPERFTNGTLTFVRHAAVTTPGCICPFPRTHCPPCIYLCLARDKATTAEAAVTTPEPTTQAIKGPQ